MIATVLDAESLADLAIELSGAGLPVSDIAEPGRRFFRFEDDGGIIGYGGIEGTGPDRLLRSLVVRPGRRGRGSEPAMLAAIERAAADKGAPRSRLLVHVGSRQVSPPRPSDAAPETYCNDMVAYRLKRI